LAPNWDGFREWISTGMPIHLLWHTGSKSEMIYREKLGFPWTLHGEEADFVLDFQTQRLPLHPF